MSMKGARRDLRVGTYLICPTKGCGQAHALLVRMHSLAGLVYFRPLEKETRKGGLFSPWECNKCKQRSPDGWHDYTTFQYSSLMAALLERD